MTYKAADFAAEHAPTERGRCAACEYTQSPCLTWTLAEDLATALNALDELRRTSLEMTVDARDSLEGIADGWAITETDQ